MIPQAEGRYVDLGDNHSYVWVTHAPHKRIGIILKHTFEAEGRQQTCHLYVGFEGSNATHKLIAVHALSVEGVIACDACHDSGYIHDGAWSDKPQTLQESA